MRVERQLLFWISALAIVLLVIATLRDVLLPFVVGGVLAYFLNPAADWLERRGLPRTVASVLIVVLGAVLLVGLLVLVVPALVNQAHQLAIALPGEIERLRGLIEAWARELLGPRFPEFEAGLDTASRAAADNWAGVATWLAGSLWTRSLAVFNFLSLMLVTPLVIFYLLVDWHAMLSKVDSWLPRAQAPTIRRLACEIDGAVSAFIRGQGLVCVILGAFYATALSVAGLRYGLLVGLMTGLLSFVPFVGWALGLIVASVLAVVQFWPATGPILLVVGIFLAGQAIDAAVLSPKIVGEKIGLHPVWLIFALLVFSYLFGSVGMLVAVPVAAATGVIVRFAIDSYLQSPLYHSAGADGAVEPHLAPREAPDR